MTISMDVSGYVYVFRFKVYVLMDMISFLFLHPFVIILANGQIHNQRDVFGHKMEIKCFNH